MKQVWRCDFCPTFNESRETISAHESRCGFNPAMRRCWSCLHRVDEGAPIGGFYNGCNAGVTRTSQVDVEDGALRCALHEQQEG